MDAELKKKILYTVVAGILLFFAVLALLLLLRKPQKQIVITKEQYIKETTAEPGKGNDISGFLPSITEGKITPAPTAAASDQPLSPDATSSVSWQKGFQFLTQAMTLPVAIVSSFLPQSGCGTGGKPVCVDTPSRITIVTEQTVTKLTVIQQVVEIPQSVLDSLQDIVFYKLITVLQQSVIANDEYPAQSDPEGTSWLTQLIETKEMSQFYYDVFRKTTPAASACGTAKQTGFCYESDGKIAVLYVRMKAGTTECPHGAIKSWNSDKNALQLTCFASSEQ